jgi:hypothetical protein
MAHPNQRVRVLRGFRHNGQIQGPKTVLDLSKPFAIEMRTANKVEFVQSDTKLQHVTELPDPNRVLADRQAQRAAALAATKEAATKAAGGK